MGLYFEMAMLRNKQRPLIEVRSILENKVSVTALLDTGALFPVWNAEENLLKDMGARLIKTGIKFGGFGGNAVGSLYRLTLVVGEIVFPELSIIACENKAIDCSIVLSATMFDKINYEINNVEHKVKFYLTSEQDKVRNLIINSDNVETSVCCHNVGDNHNANSYKDNFGESSSFKI